MEWGYHQVYYAVECNPFDKSKLTYIPAERYQELKFRLNPASQLFSFQHSILRIWQFCQKKEEDQNTLELTEGGINLLVIRRNLEIEFEVLSPGEYVFLLSFSQSKTFSEACRAGLHIEPKLDIPQTLNHHIQKNTFVDITP